MVIGDFNNVVKVEYRIGGSNVTENEYIDLIEMMNNTELYEMESDGDYFMLSNKQKENTIYSRINRILGNVEWMQQNVDNTLNEYEP